MQVLSSTTPREQAARKLADALSTLGGTPVLLLVSGGSALPLLDLVPPTVLSAEVTLGVLDERFTTDPQQHNFSLLSQTAFFERALAAGVRVISTTVEVTDTKETLAQRFTEALQNWRQENPNGKIIVTMGMGEDGHTAGIFPSVPLPLNGSVWVTAVQLPEGSNPQRERVSVTQSFLITEVAVAVVYVTGEAKQGMLQAIYTRTAVVPALVWHDMKEVYIFTDQIVE